MVVSSLFAQTTSMMPNEEDGSVDGEILVTSNRNWYMRNFFNHSYGHPWTIPKTISKITTSFSSLTISIFF
jgi:hypothetical protein